MAKTLNAIQQAVKYITNDDSVILTDGFGRVLANRVYRGLVVTFNWPEFWRRAILASPTVVDQENYELTGEDMPLYSDLKHVEVLSLSYDYDTTNVDVMGIGSTTAATARYTWKMIQIPPNEWEWNLAARRGSTDTPLWFKRFKSNRHILVAADVGSGTDRWHSVNDGTTWVQSTSANIGDEVRYYAATDGAGTGATTATNTDRIALRPTPSVAGYEIMVNGITEPTALTSQSSTTGFLLANADDALEYLLAAAWAFKLEKENVGKVNLEQAAVRLRSIFGKEQVTTETIRGLI